MKPLATANYDFEGLIEGGYVYVFEFKFNRSAKAAIRQIREKGYADAYKADTRPVTLIGINFSAKKRNIDEPIIEPL